MQYEGRVWGVWGKFSQFSQQCPWNFCNPKVLIPTWRHRASATDKSKRYLQLRKSTRHYKIRHTGPDFFTYILGLHVCSFPTSCELCAKPTQGISELTYNAIEIQTVNTLRLSEYSSLDIKRKMYCDARNGAFRFQFQVTKYAFLIKTHLSPSYHCNQTQNVSIQMQYVSPELPSYFSALCLQQCMHIPKIHTYHK